MYERAASALVSLNEAGPLLVSSDQFLPGEPELLTDLFEAGLKRLHLRKPAGSLMDMALLLKGVPPVFHSRIVVHGNTQELSRLLKDFRVGGIHLKLDDLRAYKSIRSLPHLAPNATVSTSCHLRAEIEEVDGLCRTGLPPDYAFVSPVFPSISKPGYGPTIGHKELREVLENVRIPLVALGGVHQAEFDYLQDLGFSGAALLGAVWNAAEPLDTWRKTTALSELNA